MGIAVLTTVYMSLVDLQAKFVKVHSPTDNSHKETFGTPIEICPSTLPRFVLTTYGNLPP